MYIYILYINIYIYIYCLFLWDPMGTFKPKCQSLRNKSKVYCGLPPLQAQTAPLAQSLPAPCFRASLPIQTQKTRIGYPLVN